MIFVRFVKTTSRPFFWNRKTWPGTGPPNESALLVNLQENNGLLRINMTDLTADAVAGYGLTDHSVVPVDINDIECRLKRYPSLFVRRNPDTIQTFKVQ
jgi:hypothetical protein